MKAMNLLPECFFKSNSESTLKSVIMFINTKIIVLKIIKQGKNYIDYMHGYKRDIATNYQVPQMVKTKVSQS